MKAYVITLEHRGKKMYYSHLQWNQTQMQFNFIFEESIMDGVKFMTQEKANDLYQEIKDRCNEVSMIEHPTIFDYPLCEVDASTIKVQEIAITITEV